MHCPRRIKAHGAATELADSAAPAQAGGAAACQAKEQITAGRVCRQDRATDSTDHHRKCPGDGTDTRSRGQTQISARTQSASRTGDRTGSSAAGIGRKRHGTRCRHIGANRNAAGFVDEIKRSRICRRQRQGYGDDTSVIGVADHNLAGANAVKLCVLKLQGACCRVARSVGDKLDFIAEGPGCQRYRIGTRCNRVPDIELVCGQRYVTRGGNDVAGHGRKRQLSGESRKIYRRAGNTCNAIHHPDREIIGIGKSHTLPGRSRREIVDVGADVGEIDRTTRRQREILVAGDPTRGGGDARTAGQRQIGRCGHVGTDRDGTATGIAHTQRSGTHGAEFHAGQTQGSAAVRSTKIDELVIGRLRERYRGRIAGTRAGTADLRCRIECHGIRRQGRRAGGKQEGAGIER